MNKNLLLIASFILMLVTTATAQNPDKLLLKDYRPKSIYKIPITTVPKAKYPAIDLHSHPYAESEAEIAQWVKTMDQVGVEKSVILSYSTGARFYSIQRQY